jgi:hypothetical protein
MKFRASAGETILSAGLNQNNLSNDSGVESRGISVGS